MSHCTESISKKLLSKNFPNPTELKKTTPTPQKKTQNQPNKTNYIIKLYEVHLTLMRYFYVSCLGSEKFHGGRIQMRSLTQCMHFHFHLQIRKWLLSLGKG